MNLFDKLASVRTAFKIIVIVLLWVIAGFYFSPGLEDGLLYNLWFNLLVCVLALSLLVCTVKRARKLLCTKAGSYISFKWGSVVFHAGMLIILLGFGVTSLWGMRGKVIIPEGVAVAFPADIFEVKKGAWHEYEEFKAGLNKFNLITEDRMISQVRGTVDFISGSGSERQVIEINHPAKFTGYYWRSQDWGYSAYLRVSKNNDIILNDYVNIASSGGRYFDTYNLPGTANMMKVEFYPGVNSEGNPDNAAILPQNPGLSVTIDGPGEMAVNALVLMGESALLGDYQIEFVDYRFWEQFDISKDPGEVFIYLGSIMAVFGLALRVLSDLLGKTG